MPAIRLLGSWPATNPEARTLPIADLAGEATTGAGHVGEAISLPGALDRAAWNRNRCGDNPGSVPRQ